MILTAVQALAVSSGVSAPLNFHQLETNFAGAWPPFSALSHLLGQKGREDNEPTWTKADKEYLKTRAGQHS